MLNIWFFKKNDFIFKSIKIDENMLKNRKPIELLI